MVKQTAETEEVMAYKFDAIERRQSHLCLPLLPPGQTVQLDNQKTLANDCRSFLIVIVRAYASLDRVNV